MPLTPGLSANMRLPPPDGEPAITDGIIIEYTQDGGDVPEFDDTGNVVRIDHEDGSVTVSLDGKPIEQVTGANDNLEWFGNIVERISDGGLTSISGDLLRGIENDIQSRSKWIDDRAQGMKLLGLELETPGLGGTADGAPVEGMSRVRHPLLLEAVLRFQANARSELLPTDGPVKIRDDSVGSTVEHTELADALEKDMNAYLTSRATEYYPDTDRMLLMLGFGGSAFKKVYFDPIRNRPVSETVDADDLIVNWSATDLMNARRVTQRIVMRPSVVKRMQILGAYRDIDLGDPKPIQPDAVKQAKDEQQGISNSTFSVLDRDREIYECYCELDIPGFEHKMKGGATGLELPYIVTIDVSSQTILSVVRNYDQPEKDSPTEDLPTARSNFVAYTFIPGFGFYGIGLLHILGNTTNALTAAWRELLDAGMFSNFPGFLISDTGARQNTNIIRVPPGGGATVKTGGQKISDAIMPLPYKEPSQALMALAENIASTGQRIGGTAEANVGEGRENAPVGTTLANIEQAEKILNSVHKRMHASQAEEFRLLIRCFREHPESFWTWCKKPSADWSTAKFLQALDECDLTPQADPNTASHGQRVMKIMALKQLQAANPALYDPIAIDKAALAAIGWSNPEQFMVPVAAQHQVPPEVQKVIKELQIKQQDADSRKLSAQATMLKAQSDTAGAQPAGPPSAVDEAEAQSKLIDAHTKARDLDVRLQEAGIDAQSKAQDSATKLAIEHLRSQHDARSDDMDLQKEREESQREALRIASEMRQQDDANKHEDGQKQIDVAMQRAEHANAVKVAAKKPTPKKGDGK